LLLLQFVRARAPTYLRATQVVVERARGPKGQPLKVAECIVGDETGTIVFTARNEQGEPRLDAVCMIQRCN
jgi:ssDNA-binding replication factor A large subunit